MRFLGRRSFWVGLILVLLYLYSVHPIGFGRAYSEDMCLPDLLRQLMAHQLEQFGKPGFVTDRLMTPFLASLPYMSWSIERDWLGAYFWKWNPDFPFLWFYFGVSLVASYLGVGYILKKMKLSPSSAWWISLAVVVFHVPRHFKIWHHYEHLLQHWVYWSLFLDAWIWQRLWRGRRWSWNLELWRGLCLLGMLGTAGYFWGPLILEWVLVRVAMVGLVLVRGKSTVQVAGAPKKAILPVALGMILLILDLRWFIPLSAEVKRLGDVPQIMSWFAELSAVLRPLWAEALRVSWIFPGGLPRIDAPETVVSIGWSYWLLAVLGTVVLVVRRGISALSVFLPFWGLLCIALLYMGTGAPDYHLQKLIQAYVPFMPFFRVASRWGLFLPQFVAICIVLAWPELSDWARQWRRATGKKAWAWRGSVAAFMVMTGAELVWLAYPVNMMPPLPDAVKQMLERIRQAPGTSVLNLPFCVTGGNGVCAGEQCPNYPYSTAPQCLAGWHDKKVYGVYASRLMFSDCEFYHRQPYLSWFNAWRGQRCFSDNEWNDFCQYLGQHPELAAVLVFPDIWQGAGTAECQQKFELHLGPPLGGERFFMSPTRGGHESGPNRVFWYAPHCRT